MFIKLNNKINDLLSTNLEEVNKINVKKDLPINNYLRLDRNGDNVSITLLQNNTSVGEFEIKEFAKLNVLFKYRDSFIAEFQKDSSINVVTFVDLHGHTGSSLLDGMIRPKDFVNKSVYSRAITDHGVMYGCVDFYKLMKKSHKKPIIGFEAYTEEKYANINDKPKRRHLVLLAKNEIGYQNISMLSTLGHTNLIGTNQKRPTVKHEWLEEHSEGVIALSACMGGEIQQYILNDKEQQAIDLAKHYKSLYGEDFYMEIQRHDIPEEIELNKKLIEIAKDLEIKVVATSDAHYLNKEDSIVHEIHLCNQTGKKLSDVNRFKFPGTDYHIHTIEEMEAKFRDMPEVLFNTLEIMEKINFDFEFGNYKMPKFPVPEGMTETDYLKQLAWEGFDKRFPVGTTINSSTEYRERMDFELDVIVKMGYEAYFLIVWDFVKYAKDNGYPVGPGRGSACGSLVSYTLAITEVDPIPYGLLFERFLNPDRKSMPDIDMDFGNLIREDVINYCREKYGAESVSRIITFSTLSAKAVVKDVARIVYSEEEDKKLGDMISKTIPTKPKMTIAKAFDESPEFKNLYETNEKVKRVIDYAMVMEGLPKACSQHACFDKDTMVTTEKGLKAISEIKVGDMVLTHNNRFMPVTETMVTNTEEVYTLKTSCSLPLEVTANHPMLTREMTINSSLRKREWSNPKWKEVSELNINTDYIGIAINQNSLIPKHDNLSLPFENENFWWVIGRYIGDGWTECLKRTQGNTKCNEERVVICCSKKDNSELEEIIENLKKSNLDHRFEEANTTFKIYIKSNDLYVYLQQFGKYAHSKFLTNDILDLPINLAKSFIKGYISADGYINKKTARHQIKTVSKELAIGISMLINKAYKRFVTINVLKRGTEIIEGRTVNARTVYQIYFTLAKKSREKSFYENGYIWTRVSDLSIKEETKPMYNLTIKGDNSYTVHGLIAHNCGVIIADQSVRNYCPQVFLEDKDTKIVSPTTQYVMGLCEELGLLKMDFLGLKTMTVLDENVKDINEIYDKDLTIDTIPINDPLTYENIAKGKTVGVFQLESPGMTSFMTNLFQDVSKKISNIRKSTLSEEEKEEEFAKLGDILFERLVAGISLYRPGPMDEIPRYIDGMLNPSHIVYDTPELENILKVTYGVIVYQEQVMTAVRELSGFNRGQADTIRKSMGKKITEILDEYREYFIYGSGDKLDSKTGKEIGIKGCVASGIDESKAIKIWDKMYEFSKYALTKH